MQVKPVLETQPTLDDILMTVCKLLYKNNNKQEKKRNLKSRHYVHGARKKKDVKGPCSGSGITK